MNRLHPLLALRTVLCTFALVMSLSLPSLAGAQAGSGGIRAWGVMALSESATSQAPIIQTSAGLGHVLALRADGTVVAWGLNRDNQAIVPTGLGQVIQVAAGTYFSLALKADGTVIAWGSN